MLRIIIICLFLILIHPVFGQADEWTSYKSNFLEQYSSLEIAPISLAYQDNLRAIKGKEELHRQQEVLNQLEKELAVLDLHGIDAVQRLEYGFFKYVIDLNKERLVLEMRWNTNRPDNIPSGGLHLIKDSKAWYEYLLKRWLDLYVDVDSLYAFGKSDIQRAKSKIDQIQARSGKDPESFARYLDSEVFLTTDTDSVQKLFEQYDRWLAPKLTKFFPRISEIPAVRITRGDNPRLAQVPGYYSGNTFYYNLFDKPFNKRQVAFLYLHEALPGHHYEVSHRSLADRNEMNSLLDLPGYGEGWAAYVEEIAYETGLYQTLYDELGRWEWDLIRSVRVVLDIGLNYYGWSDEKALDFWQRHNADKEEIGKREIARMRRWPVQVITYKYGASKLLEWKEKLESEPDFDLIAFHRKLLGRGPMPYSVLEKYVLQDEYK